MILHFDHVTVAVRDVPEATRFFGLLGFQVEKAVVISGSQFARYMGVDGIEADHITMVLPGVTPRTEVQLLHYRHPEPAPDPAIPNLCRVGFNHICFAVQDLDAEVARLTVAGVRLRNKVMDFHGRKLVFLTGPEGITVELAEWSSKERSELPVEASSGQDDGTRKP